MSTTADYAIGASLGINTTNNGLLEDGGLTGLAG